MFRMVLSTCIGGQDVSDLQRQVSSIAKFLRRHEWLWRAHVVDFFKGKFWERVDDEWNNCLRLASVENWLLLPSGVVQEDWPDSLKEFVQAAFQLSLSRVPVDALTEMSCSGVPQAPIGSVLAQGMSAKKLHEIGILAALISRTAKLRAAKDVIDVGAGQGYLALVLAFEYKLSVRAVDACAHHADVTNKRALNIQKHYNSRFRKLQPEVLKHPNVRAPQTVTCRVGSGEAPAALSSLLTAMQETKSVEILARERSADHDEEASRNEKDHGVVLAGLHACGDLSATMLRTFVECQDVAAVINVGCCYNLLSDESTNDMKECCGFPMSEAVGNLGLQLGRSARDLACQSAERWKEHHPGRALRNFELHAFRAAFQLILERYYPETAMKSPSVGRVGKSRRRRQARQAAMDPLIDDIGVADSTGNNKIYMGCVTSVSGGLATNYYQGTTRHSSTCGLDEIARLSRVKNAVGHEHGETSSTVDGKTNFCRQREDVEGRNSNLISGTKGAFERQTIRFEEYARSALERLDLPPLALQELKSVWNELAPYTDLVGPFWSLRAVLAPVLESYILLDRLLYLKEQTISVSAEKEKDARITAELVPIFDPSISPRNMAIIAYRGGL